MSSPSHYTRSTAPESEVLVRVENVSKKFCRDLKKSLWYGVKDVASELFPLSYNKVQSTKNNEPALRDCEFWAVKDVSFELRRGECLGLIGRNGAGKTTLLKMLNGLIKPDTGRIEMRGRVGALIALGAGFTPILSGRENIYVNGSILGLSKAEIDAKIDEIIDFAEIGDFIDAPVQSYSSGMQVRLGFAVATAMEPDVLILDEVLAVGDASFRNKCYRRISEIRRSSAILFVSHNMEQIGRICSSVCHLSKGKVRIIDNVEVGIKSYEDSLNDGVGEGDSFVKSAPHIRDFSVAISQNKIEWNSLFFVRVGIYLLKDVPDLFFRLVFYNSIGSWVADSTSSLKIDVDKRDISVNIEIPNLSIKPGFYYVTLHVIDADGDIVAWSHKQLSISVVGVNKYGYADCSLKSVCENMSL